MLRALDEKKNEEMSVLSVAWSKMSKNLKSKHGGISFWELTFLRILWRADQNVKLLNKNWLL